MHSTRAVLIASVLVLAGAPPFAAAQLGVWRNEQPLSSPPFHAGGGLAFEPATSRMIAFGGVTDATATTVFSDTWAYDGCGWLQLFPPTNPGTRYNTHLAQSPNAGRLVLFGGSVVPYTLDGTTWEFNAPTTSWINMTPAGPSPSAREVASITYDSARGRTVLFGGGYSITGSFNDETWEWDGSAWANVTPLGPKPSPRAWAAMTYDALRARTVLYGGYDGSQLGDTWEWDGTQWFQIPTASSPGPRSSTALAYDFWSHRVVLYGGSVGWPIGLNDTWEYDGFNWYQITTTGATPPTVYLERLEGDPVRGGVIMFEAYTNNWGMFSETWRYRTAQLSATTLLPPVGSSVGYSLSIPSEPFLPYLAATSVSGTCPGVPLPDGRVVQLTPDALTTAQLAGVFPTVFVGFSGVLSSIGTANMTIAIPSLPWLSGLQVTTAAITAVGPLISSVTNPVTIVIQ